MQPTTNYSKQTNQQAVNQAKKVTTNEQGKYWIGTISPQLWTPTETLPIECAFLRGQLEEGDQTGRIHWQVVVGFKKKVRKLTVKRFFGFTTGEERQCHVELTISAKANEYVLKDETCVDTATRFDLGKLPFKRNSATDWQQAKELMIAGRLDELPPDIFIKHYNVAKRIKLDHMVFQDVDKEVRCYWGVTGSGKSHLARQEAGKDVYIKDPCTKWWDGYRPDEHKNIIIEEFTGSINISHMLRWLDKWGSAAEAKQGGVPFTAEKIWITSNVDPRKWYPDANEQQVAALLRRMTIVEFKEAYKPPAPQNSPENDNARFWQNAPGPKAGIPIGDIMEVPEWRDYLGDLLDPSPEPNPELGPIPDSWQPQAKPQKEIFEYINWTDEEEE